MTSRLHAIREACVLENEFRSDENIDGILDFVKDVKFFARLSVLQQRSLCRTMQLEEYGPREFVFQMGENGDKFFIILTGSVGVQVPSQTAPCPNDFHLERCDCPNRPLETVVFLEKGMGFGELALQSDQPRSATIQTSEKTELLVTKRCDYEMYAGQLHRQFIEQRVKFLRQCPRIEDALQMGLVSTQDIAAMANCLNEVQLSGNAVACRQGDVVDHMIFVRVGQLATLRCVDVDQKQPEAEGGKAGSKSRSTLNSGGKDPAKAQAQEPKAGERDLLEGEGDYQPQWQLTQNLAKAMMESKKKDRHAKLEVIADHEHEEEEKRKVALNTLRFGGGYQRGLAAAKKADSESESGNESSDTGRAKQLWNRLKTSVRSSAALNKFCGGVGEETEKGDTIEKAHKNVEHFAEVQAARKRYTEHVFKNKRDEKAAQNNKAKTGSKQHPAPRKSVIKNTPHLHSTKVEQPQPKKRMRILRIGTVGPYEYFGDQQVFSNECYPVSLVSDPVAEIYVMSKHDIMRRVPKKLFSALFNIEPEAQPSDFQLIEMHKQTERWNSFRRSMHGEALGNLSARNQNTGGRSMASGSRIDSIANLDFLGVNPSSNLGASLLPLPQNKGSSLTPKDEELFSQASARFLRRFDIMKRDGGLREALAKAGLMRNARLHDGLPGSALDDDDEDPMAFRFEQHWTKMQNDPVELDLDDALPITESSADKQAAASSSGPITFPGPASPASGSTNRPARPSVAPTGGPRRRASAMVGEPQTKGRQSSSGGTGPMNDSLQGQEEWARQISGSAAARTSMLNAPAGTSAGAKRSSQLPPLDSARDGKSGKTPPGTGSGSARRHVGFNES